MHSREKLDLIVSWLTISVAFALVASRLSFADFAVLLPIMFIVVGSSFVVHELMHRFVAMKLGAHAEYVAWPFGLLLAIIMPIITFGRFVFAAPGAVYIFSHDLTREEEGLISVAGPASNIVMGFIFWLLSLLTLQGSFLSVVCIWGAYINFFLAFFNLLPVPPLDGSKVIVWNKFVWLIAIAVAGFASFFLF